MAASNFEELIAHKGHKIVMVTYESADAVYGVAIECEDCSEVLMDYDNEEMLNKVYKIEDTEIK